MNWEKYEPKLPCPNRNNFSTTWYYAKGQLVETIPGKGPEKPGFTREVGFDKEGFDKAMSIYRTEKTRCFNHLKTDILEDVGMTGHPKADKLFNLAWSHERSNGLDCVLEMAEELAELLR